MSSHICIQNELIFVFVVAKKNIILNVTVASHGVERMVPTFSPEYPNKKVGKTTDDDAGNGGAHVECYIHLSIGCKDTKISIIINKH